MKLIDFFSVILPRPPDADRPDTLFPDTTLVRAPMRQLKTRKQCWRRCATQAIRRHGSLPTVRLVEQVTRTCPVFFQSGSATSMTRRLAAFVTLTSLSSEEHTSDLQSLMRISYAVSCLHKKPYHLPILILLS